MTIIDVLIVSGCGGLTLCLAVLWLKADRTAVLEPPLAGNVALLFYGTKLHHMSQEAARWFPIEPGKHGWRDMCDIAREHFADFPEKPVIRDGTLISANGSDSENLGQVHFHRNGIKTWVVFDAINHVEVAQLEELPARPFEHAAETSPNPIWQTDLDGKLIWSNRAFDDISTSDKHPLTTLNTDDWTSGAPRRHQVETPGADPKWFDITRIEMEDRLVFHTQDSTALVAAQDAKRDFVQTLAKTFAHLSIGLAIFDRRRQLALFNPALVDLSGLGPEFLSGQPTMLAFFDHLREARRMPEPKNYRSWRQEISDVIAKASGGRYQESWSLESGQTFRVTGRPHPDGATAFLIEDISAEITLTRNFRTELELGHMMLDAVDDALVVFSRSGVLTFCNEAYRRLWSLDPDSSFADMNLRDNIAAWREKCEPTTVWQDIENITFTHGHRNTRQYSMTMRPDHLVHCEVHPMPSGQTLVKFMRQRVFEEPLDEELMQEPG